MPTKVTYIHVKLLITDFIKNIPKTYLQQRRIFIMEQKMFCYQCEQTAGCNACTGAAGVCGKDAAVAALQDELTGALIGQKPVEITRKQKIPTASSLKDYLQPSRM